MPPIKRHNPDITPHEKQALAIQDAALDGCTTCRQTKAEHLTAVATGITLGNAITEATGDTSHLEEAAKLARNGDWQETHKTVYAALKTALHRSAANLIEHGNYALQDAVSILHLLNLDAELAVSNLRMADECLNGTFIQQNDGYTAAQHLWTCQTMAIGAACSLLLYHRQTLQMGRDIAAPQCTHTQDRPDCEIELSCAEPAMAMA